GRARLRPPDRRHRAHLNRLLRFRWQAFTCTGTLVTFRALGPRAWVRSAYGESACHGGTGPTVSRSTAIDIVAGNSKRALAEASAAYLNLPLTKASVKRFSDMEVWVEINENVRGQDVFVIQSTSFPANDNLMELLVCLDALKRASARRI